MDPDLKQRLIPWVIRYKEVMNAVFWSMLVFLFLKKVNAFSGRAREWIDEGTGVSTQKMSILFMVVLRRLLLVAGAAIVGVLIYRISTGPSSAP